MCGIAGIAAGGAPMDRDALARRAGAMAARLVQRGPDRAGLWADPDGRVALGFRRLAILDLSAAGDQPMASACGRWHIVYNGEIYNFAELRRDLEARGHRFRGRSDTEALLEHVAAHGVEATLARLVGMFAIALWDARDKRLWLVRDRLGIKPLYWGEADGAFLFASELKAIRAGLETAPEVDRAALAAYLKAGNVPAPMSIYRGIAKLEPGTVLSWSPGESPRIARYWSMADVVAQPRAALDEREAVERADALIRQAVRARLVSDVPLGALLSGGIDSTAVVAAMRAEAAGPVRSFTIGFEEAGYDEAAHARAVAVHLGTDHTELTLGPDDARALIPDLPDWFDEPFADSSALPTYLVCRLARAHVTVALSGDGGDEVFFGYNRHVAGAAALRRLGSVPAPLRGLAAGLIGTVPTRGWDALALVLPERRRPRMLGDKLHKLARAMTARSVDGFYQGLIARWHDPSQLTGFRGTLNPPLDLPEDALAEASERMAALDTVGYLPGDILTKVDRASMAVGLEARVPLLDHRLVEFAWTLPARLKVRDGAGKWLLRQVLYRSVPRDLMERPKAGFAIPLADWLKGPLRDWAEALFDENAMRAQGLIDPKPVRALWAAHLAGRGNHAEALWTVAMLNAWTARWL